MYTPPGMILPTGLDRIEMNPYARIHAHWIFKFNTNEGFSNWHCSYCGYKPRQIGNYCLNCGAEMSYDKNYEETLKNKSVYSYTTFDSYLKGVYQLAIADFYELSDVQQISLEKEWRDISISQEKHGV